MNELTVRRGRAAKYAWLLAAACAIWPLAETAADETKLKTEVVAAADLNPNLRGRPQPVKLYIFYLVEDEKFMQANFFDLVGAEVPALGDVLVRRAEHLVGPGETLPLDEAFDEAAKFIGVVAAFTQLEQAQWRAVAAVPARRWTDVLRLFKGSKLEILVDGTTVTCAIVED
jgi:type VI secretion system protein VasD